MFNIFKKKAIEIRSPISGKVTPVDNVPDEVFASKMVGDGVAIEAAEGIVVAPVDGEVVQLFPTNHAIGLKTSDGVEVLVHIGIDTVEMKGEGFKAFIKKGDKVRTGQKMVEFDLNLVKEKAKSAISPVVITNSGQMASVEKMYGFATKGIDIIMKISKK